MFGKRKSKNPQPALSVVVPVHNEEENIERLHQRLLSVLRKIEGETEILYVDDGSTDRTPGLLAECVAAVRNTETEINVSVIVLRRNYGQSAALAAGFDHARGRVVVTLDADLQNPPEEIPRLLAKLHEGYDLVSGWRKDRRDESTRSFLSRTANRLIGSVTGVPLHDYGCTLKAYRREILDDIELYGELHRFLPALGAWAGARIAEIEVAHNPRTAGRSHYGSERILKVFFDLITVKLLMSFSTKPAYVFGLGGVVTLVTSVLLGLFAIYRKIFLGGEWMSPITIISIVFFPLAVQFFLLGFIAEIATRAYHGARRKKTYAVRTRVSSAEGEISRRDRPPD